MFEDRTAYRPYTIDATEIRQLITARIDSIGAVLAQLEAVEAHDRDEAEYLTNAARGWREESAELAFLRDHVRDGGHSLTSEEMARLRENTQPAEAPSLEQARRLRGLSVSSTYQDVGTVRAGRVRLF